MPLRDQHALLLVKAVVRALHQQFIVRQLHRVVNEAAQQQTDGVYPVRIFDQIVIHQRHIGVDLAFKAVIRFGIPLRLHLIDVDERPGLIVVVQRTAAAGIKGRFLPVDLRRIGEGTAFQVEPRRQNGMLRRHRHDQQRVRIDEGDLVIGDMLCLKERLLPRGDIIGTQAVVGGQHPRLRPSGIVDDAVSP